MNIERKQENCKISYYKQRNNKSVLMIQNSIYNNINKLWINQK